MATMKLYPPVLAGTTPPFYVSETGSYILTVPFSFNKLVTASEVGGVKLRIRDGETDIELGRVNATVYSVSTSYSYAEFDLTNIKGINLGKYYKIQLAYIDAADASNIGYYSTISIVKCTAYPSVSCLGLNRYSANIDVTYYVGHYSNINDPSEKCYQYRFTLYDTAGKVLTTTDWQVHNANTDDAQYESTDSFILNYNCQDDERYRLQYSVITQNGLQVNGPLYIIVGGSSVVPEIDAHLIAQLDYDNGCVDLFLKPNDPNKTELTYNGMFMISRCSSAEDFTIQTQIATFNLTGMLPANAVFHDFTVEQGQTYRYSIQQFNNYDIYSTRMYAPDVYVVFEDAFLYDGERQLKIRFNPKITSFKTVIQDTKKNTLGSKYPFFFRNGNVEYKEFPISGLISYLSDENEFFLSRTEDLKMDKWWSNTTDIIDDNIAYERRFKLEVLNWLNDGNIKLFRSPGEGNYLVRLSNVSLVPNDTLSRMIHTFSCTADEIDAYSPSKLGEYGFLSVDKDATLAFRFGVINFADYLNTLISVIQGSSDLTNVSEETLNKAIEEFKNTNLLKGNKCQYIRFEDCVSTDYRDAGMSGREVWFTYDGVTNYLVGATGQYEIQFDEDSAVSNLKLLNVWKDMPGQVTVGTWTRDSTVFDGVTKIVQRDVVHCPSYLGVSSSMTGNNYMDTISTLKDQIRGIVSMDFTLSDMVYEIGSLQAFGETYHFSATPREKNAIDQFNERVSTYLLDRAVRVWSIEFEQDKDTKETESSSSVLPYGTRSSRDLFVNNAMFTVPGTDIYYIFDADANLLYEFNNGRPYVPVQQPDGTLYRLSPTQICLDNEIIDIAETGSYHVPTTSWVPTYMAWGTKVQPIFIYQLLTLTYGVEEGDKAKQVALGLNESLYNAWKQYNAIARDYAAYQLQLINITEGAKALVNNVPDGMYEDNSYFVWNENTQHFDRLTREERTAFTGQDIWVPYSYSTYSKDHSYNGPFVTYAEYSSVRDNYLSMLKAVLELEGVDINKINQTSTSTTKPTSSKNEGVIYEDSGKMGKPRFGG